MPDFPVDKTIADYRSVTERRDAELTTRGREALNAEADRLRKAWKDWQGEDCLHETVFGEG